MAYPRNGSTSAKVLLLFTAHDEINCRVIEGVNEYARAQTQWEIELLPKHLVTNIDDAVADGVCGVISNVKLGWDAARVPVPVVLTFSIAADLGMPVVLPDNHLIGQVAAEHFLHDRGLKHLAVFATGDTQRRGAQQRLAGFLETAKRADKHAEVFVCGRRTEAGWNIKDQIADLVDWLGQLPRPVGVYAIDDDHASRIYTACRQAGIAIPDEVAVIGTGDKSTICELLGPSLSSVWWSAEEIGRQAGALLNDLMSGEPEPQGPVRVPPRGVTVRQSSSMRASSDPEVRRAVAYMHDNLPDLQSLDDVAAHCQMSLRTLYRRFIDESGENPGAVLRRIRMHHARRLLQDSELSLAQIADRTGFSSASQLSRAVRQSTGRTPTQIRADA